MNSVLLTKIASNRLLQHSLFWCLSYYLLLRVFSYSDHSEAIDYIYTAFFHINIVIGVYVNLYVLIPLFLKQRKFVLYFLALTLLIFMSSELNILIFDYLIDFILSGYYFISYYELSDIVKFMLGYIGITTLFKLSKKWLNLLETNNRLIQLQKEKIENDLKFLKAQINPHFLFNSLNSVYSLALSNAPETPGIILKLSDILRYMLYEADEKKVGLRKEIDCLNKYIEFQKLRISKTYNIKYTITGEITDQTISPLLLIPLVENSFKHGIVKEQGRSFIIIEVTVSKERFDFKIENSKGINSTNMSSKGIGLENIRKRLELLYKNCYTFNIMETSGKFRVELSIKL